MKRKLTLVISTLQGGGAERVMTSLAGVWAEAGVDVTLITFDCPARPEAYTVDLRVKRLFLNWDQASGSWRKFRVCFRRVVGIRRHLRMEKPDAVLSFMTETNVFVILAAAGTGVRCVVSERTDPAKVRVGVLWRGARRLLYRRAYRVVAQTERVAAWLRAEVGGSTIVIPNFSREPASRATGAPRRAVFGIGRLVPVKGFDVLIRAFAKVATAIPGWELVLIGDGPAREQLWSLAQELGVEALVQFAGRVQQPGEWLSSDSIMVCSSHYEGFPNALLEAMGMGVAAIATATAGDMLVRDEVDGLLVPPDDVARLACALERLMQDPALRREFGRRATEVRTRFSQASVMGLWESALFAR